MAEYKDTQHQAMEEMSENEGPGVIEVNDEALRKIIVMTTLAVEGVHIPRAKNWIGYAKDTDKTVMLKKRERNLSIGINVQIDYGRNIYEICRELQRRIKSAIETMTATPVDQVNITVEDLKMPLPDQSDEAEERQLLEEPQPEPVEAANHDAGEVEGEGESGRESA